MLSTARVRLENCEPAFVENYTTDLSRLVSLRVYSSTEPCNLKIANLQKGLVFVHNGVEQIGEGAGFGLPVLMYENETCFSGSSTVTVIREGSSTKIRKEFLMDRVARNKFRSLHLQNKEVRTLMRYLSLLYQKNKFCRLLALRKLTLNFGFESAYMKASPLGKLAVTYEISKRSIDVKLEYNNLERKHLQKVLLLNEQSANFFRKYSDAKRSSAVDDQIGAWEKVNSEWACLLNLRSGIGYRLWDIENTVLRRGRETIPNFLDWVGLDYELYPQNDFFEYKIELLGVNS